MKKFELFDEDGTIFDTVKLYGEKQHEFNPVTKIKIKIGITYFTITPHCKGLQIDKINEKGQDTLNIHKSNFINECTIS